MTNMTIDAARARERERHSRETPSDVTAATAWGKETAGHPGYPGEPPHATTAVSAHTEEMQPTKAELVLNLEEEIHKALAGIQSTLEYLATLVASHPTPGKFLYEGSPLTHYMTVITKEPHQNASTP